MKEMNIGTVTYIESGSVNKLWFNVKGKYFCMTNTCMSDPSYFYILLADKYKEYIFLQFKYDMFSVFCLISRMSEDKHLFGSMYIYTCTCIQPPPPHILHLSLFGFEYSIRLGESIPLSLIRICTTCSIYQVFRIMFFLFLFINFFMS